MDNYEDWVLSEETLDYLAEDRDEYLEKIRKSMKKTQKTTKNT